VDQLSVIVAKVWTLKKKHYIRLIPSFEILGIFFLRKVSNSCAVCLSVCVKG